MLSMFDPLPKSTQKRKYKNFTNIKIFSCVKGTSFKNDFKYITGILGQVIAYTIL